MGADQRVQGRIQRPCGIGREERVEWVTAGSRLHRHVEIVLLRSTVTPIVVSVAVPVNCRARALPHRGSRENEVVNVATRSLQCPADRRPTDRDCCSATTRIATTTTATIPSADETA